MNSNQHAMTMAVGSLIGHQYLDTMNAISALETIALEIPEVEPLLAEVQVLRIALIRSMATAAAVTAQVDMKWRQQVSTN